MSKGLSHILIYSEEYQFLADALPTGIMKILVDKKVSSAFRVAKVPVLLTYTGLKESRRVYGTQKIKEAVHEMSYNI